MIIVHDEFHPIEILNAVSDLIQPSASIVVFSQYLHPLAELREHVISQKIGVFTKLEELWCREY